MASKESKADGQTLPPKEASVFRQVIRFYESKQYKKGIKAADQVGHRRSSLVRLNIALVTLASMRRGGATPSTPTPACMCCRC